MTKARDLANSAAAFAAVSATELAFVDGVTSAIQTQIDAKAPSSTAVTLTGTQTLTNKTLTSPVIASVINNTLTSTTGDIIYASAANTPARLGIGSTSQVLTVAGGIPSWATPATPTFVGVNATRTNVSTAVVANTVFQVPFPTEEFDTNGFHDTSTNTSRLTIPSGYAGKYIISAYMNNAVGSPGAYQLLVVYKNGAQYTTGGVREGLYGSSDMGANRPFGFAQLITASVADYFELYYQQNNTETVNMFFNFQLTYLGA